VSTEDRVHCWLCI